MRLVVDGLVVTRGERRVLNRVGFSLASGGALAIVGPNGAGKSTLLRTLAGLLRPDAGRVTLEGVDDDLPVRERIHLLGHLDAVKAGLTVRQNLAFARDVLGGEGDLDAALDRVGLGRLSDLPGAVLSAGQRRRLALARLLCAARPVWLLDEPTAALDAAGQDLLSALVAEHRAKGGMVAAATHAELRFADGATLDLDHRNERSQTGKTPNSDVSGPTPTPPSPLAGEGKGEGSVSGWSAI